MSPKDPLPGSSAHHPGHGPYPPGPVHRFFALEKELPLEVVAQALQRFSASLTSQRRIVLREDLEVAPPDPCLTKIHFERTAKGHLVFKFELKWEAEGSSSSNGSSDDIAGILGTAPGLGDAE